MNISNHIAAGINSNQTCDSLDLKRILEATFHASEIKMAVTKGGHLLLSKCPSVLKIGIGGLIGACMEIT